MKHKRFFHAIFLKLVIVNMVLTLTACSLFSADSPIKNMSQFANAGVANLLQSAKLSTVERADVQAGVEALKKFIADWEHIGIMLIADAAAIEAFESDLQNIVRYHTLIVDMVHRRESEYTPTALAELKRINSELNVYADKLDQLRGDAHNFSEKRKLAMRIYDNIPAVLAVVKTVL